MDVVAPVGEESVRGPLRVRIYHLGPARPTSHERGDLVDRIRRHGLFVGPLELANARHLDGQPS